MIHELDEVLGDLKRGTYRRTIVTQGEDGKTIENKLKLNDYKSQGKIVITDHLKFEDIPIITPNGEKLIDKLSFEIKSGMNLMIAGPNGCGKSALFRIIGQLWPIQGGTLNKPSSEKLVYIP